MKAGIARRSANAADLCGDMAGWWSRDGFEIVAIADGLGHGKDAAVAAEAAIEAAAAWPTSDLLGLFGYKNQVLQPTRGAAVGVAVVDWAARQITYAALGNTRAVVLGSQLTHLVGYAGIVGKSYRRLRTVSVAFNPGDLLLLWTDGLQEEIELTIADRAAPHLDDVARRLLDRFSKGNDDACILVAHLIEGSGQ